MAVPLPQVRRTLTPRTPWLAADSEEEETEGAVAGPTEAEAVEDSTKTATVSALGPAVAPRKGAGVPETETTAIVATDGSTPMPVETPAMTAIPVIPATASY